MLAINFIFRPLLEVETDFWLLDRLLPKIVMVSLCVDKTLARTGTSFMLRVCTLICLVNMEREGCKARNGGEKTWAKCRSGNGK